VADLTVIILTHNEEIHLGRAIESLRGIAKQIVVVDSLSTDRTREIAAMHGATVLQNHFINYASQFNWALDNVQIEGEWILRLDADEVLEPELVREIEERLRAIAPEITGIQVRCKWIFMDRWLKYGGRYPIYLLRIWRKGAGRIESRWMDEHVVLVRGISTKFDGKFQDHNLKGIEFFTSKHNRYATREAIDVLCDRYGLSLFPGQAPVAENISSQARLKRAAKRHVYYRLPGLMAPFLYFFYRYFLLLGFLDGKPGFIYSVLQGFWYRFLVSVRVQELDKDLQNFPTVAEKCQRLLKLAGFERAIGGAPSR
jgi:glycosyltransferase involved in cell wall biosynthesis